MSDGLPAFTEKGYLPPGTYALTLDELASSVLVVGPENRSDAWDEAHRRALVENLRILVRQLRGAGITEILVDGSFVTDGVPAGVPPATLNGKRVPQFFRETRLDEPRGIVQIIQ